MSALHVHFWGPPGGPAVLVVHGVTNTGARYRRLAAGRPAGPSRAGPRPAGPRVVDMDPPWGADVHVADLVDTLDAAGIERASVVGHSFGGLLGILLAAAAPDRVERLALLDPAVAVDPAWAAVRPRPRGATTDGPAARRPAPRAAPCVQRTRPARSTRTSTRSSTRARTAACACASRAPRRSWPGAT